MGKTGLKGIIIPLILGGIFFTHITSRAQVAFWQKFLGGSGYDIGKELIVKPDGTMIIAGESFSSDGVLSDNHSENSDILICKYATQDIYFWKHNYGGSGYEEVGDLIETRDGGYVLIGTTDSPDGDPNKNYGFLDIWVLKLDYMGKLEWSSVFGGTGNDRGFAITETYDGGFLIGGESGSVNGTMKSPHHGGLDSWIAKLSSDGELLWERHLGGTANERVVRIHETEAGKYMLIHVSNSNDGDIALHLGKKDIWITNINEFGNIESQYTYGGAENDDIHSSRFDNDNFLMLAGTTFSSTREESIHLGRGEAWVIKLDSQGRMMWNRTFGGSRSDGANDVFPTYDGGYIIIGMTRSTDGDIDFNQGYFDGWAIKINRDGFMTWNRAMGFQGKDFLLNVAEVPTGGYVALGFCEQTQDGVELPGHNGSADMWICNFGDPQRRGVKPFVTPPTLFGTVRDKNSGRLLDANITLTNNQSLETVGLSETDPVDGTFALLLPGYGLLSINVLSQGYMFHGEELRADSLNNRTEVSRKIELVPIKVGSTLILRKIYFDTGKWDLLAASNAELERLIAFLNLNPRVVIEISGHTDDTGVKEDKIQLSLNRANAVKDYLVKRGISAGRLQVEGFGMYRPIADNSTYFGRKQNRRVEFKVLSK